MAAVLQGAGGGGGGVWPHAHPGSSQETQWAENKEQMILRGKGAWG